MATQRLPTLIALVIGAACTALTVATSDASSGAGQGILVVDAPVISEPNPAAEPKIDYFAKCVADGSCAPSPRSNPLCPTGAGAHTQCLMCDYQYAREKCVRAWTEVCVQSELGGTASGCGRAYLGVCPGGGMTPCIAVMPAGYCSRTTCSSSSFF